MRASLLTYHLFRIATNLIRFLGMSRRRSTHPAIMNAGGTEIDTTEIQRVEEEIQRKLNTLNIPMKDILGKNYQPKQRHKIPPSNIKQKMIQNQCVVYASLPYTNLREIKEPKMPPVLTKRLWQKSNSNVKGDAMRPRHLHRTRRESAFARRMSVYRGYIS